MTDASEPMSAETGINLPTRAASVETVESEANGTAPRDGLEQAEGQRVDVGLGADVESQCLFRRRVAGDVGGHGCRLGPGCATNEFGHAEVDDAQAPISSEHQLRRREFRVGNPAFVSGGEGTARFEADDQRLRRLKEVGRDRTGRAGCRRRGVPPPRTPWIRHRVQ